MTIKEKKKTINFQHLAGTGQILAATVIWGYSYIVIRDSLDGFPFRTLMLLRYLIAFVVLLPFGAQHMREKKTAGRTGGRINARSDGRADGEPNGKIDRKTDKKASRRADSGFVSGQILMEGAVLGILLYAAQHFQTKALLSSDTTAGRVAFITALYVVLVPLISRIIFRKKPGPFCLLSVCLAVAGLFLLTGAGEQGFGRGDCLALAGSVCFSLHILAVDRFSGRHDTLDLTVLQFAFAAGCAVFCYFLPGAKNGPGTWGTEIITALIYLGVFSTMLGFFLQLLGQRHLPPEISAVLLAAESVFGMLFSVLLLGERLRPGGFLGCLFMLGAIILSEGKGRKTG